MKNIKTFLQEKLSKVVNDLGYELYDVEYAKKENGMNLTLFIDSDKGITIDDCEKVHRTIDPLLDELNPTNDEPYQFNVSSVGLDRPIKLDKDFKRNIGKIVTIKLFSNVNNQKEFKGQLVKFSSDTVTIEVDAEDKTFQRKDIALCKPFIEF